VFGVAVLLSCTRPSERAADDVAQEARAHFSRTAARGELEVASSHDLGAPVRISLPGEPAVALAIVPLGVRPVVGEPAAGARVFRDAVDDVDIVHVAERGRFEELRLARRTAATFELAYRVTLDEGLANLRAVVDRVEALDRRGVARLRTEPAFAIDARGVRRALAVRVEQLDGRVFQVRWSLDARDLGAPIAIDPAWTTTKSLNYPREGGALLTLPGKKVMLVGGAPQDTDARTTEVYDAATGSWTVGPSLTRPRNGATAVLLSDGRAFMPAGTGATETPPTGDLYDPAKSAWSKTTSAPYSYGSPPCFALADAKAMVIAVAGASIYDAVADTWTKTGPMVTPRGRSRGVLLPSGKALVVGGNDAGGALLSTAELFDPKTATFTTAASLPAPRQSFTMNLLPSGKVALVGGDAGTGTGIVDTVFLYDPATDKWSTGPKLGTSGRRLHASGVLADGRLLVVGGEFTFTLLSSAEILDASATGWVPAGHLADARFDFPMAPLELGGSSFLVADGYAGQYLKSAEIFTAIPEGKACDGGGECTTGACVDGICCDKPACGADETCGGVAALGTCKKKNGVACTSADSCGSGLCVDGVCCDRACTGLCEACDTKATPGRCTTLGPGEAPHGTARGACPGKGACAGLCGGVDPTTCTVFPSAATQCASATCVDGHESEPAFCDGAGSCAPANQSACEPFACGESACKRGCGVDADCASGYSCDARTGHCVFGGRCDGDHTVTVPSASAIDCTPYRCAGASCLSRCASTDDCVANTTCDTASGRCVVPESSAGAGGCDVSTGDSSSTWLLLAALVGLAKRRSR
ncbi:MAG: Kelch repeat-containing protein, partial [Polyangiales bacterium]